MNIYKMIYNFIPRGGAVTLTIDSSVSYDGKIINDYK